MSDDRKPASSDTYQEGTAPVQAFTSPVIQPAVGAGLVSRLGRPPRITPPKVGELKESIDPISTGTARFEPLEPVNLVGASIGTASSPASVGSETDVFATGSVHAVAGVTAGAAVGAAIAGALGAVIGAQVAAAMTSQSVEAKKTSLDE